jgi:hypothetical protein
LGGDRLLREALDAFNTPGSSSNEDENSTFSPQKAGKPLAVYPD